MKGVLGWWACAMLVAFAAAGPTAAQRGGCREQLAAGSTIQIVGADEPGERLVVEGRVLDADGRPLTGVVVRVYHTDAEGYYSVGGMDEANARLCGVLRSGEGGVFRVETIRPAAYADRAGPAPHVHFDVAVPGRGPRLYTVFLQEVVENGDAAAGDRRASRRPLVRQTDGGLLLVRDLVLSR